MIRVSEARDVKLTDEERVLLAGALALVFASFTEGQRLKGSLAAPQIAVGLLIEDLGKVNYVALIEKMTPSDILGKFGA